MPKYMLILGGTDKQKVIENREIAKLKYSEWTQQLIQSKKLNGANKLKDGDGRRLMFKNDRVIDGPFSETKETVGGYYIIEAMDYQDALASAKDCPVLRYQGGYVEIREIEI